jgi:hypothetical protein
MIENKQFVFIIGAPRSGSTWLHNILSSHPEIASAKKELSVFDRYVSDLVRHYEEEVEGKEQGKWDDGLPVLWDRKKFDNYVSLFIDGVYSSMNILPQHKTIIDKRPAYSLYVDIIHYYLPDAKYIHLIRDGRDASSSLNKMAEIKVWGNPLFTGSCLHWIKYKNAARKAKAFAGSNYMEIHYEDILKNPDEKISGILSFCNVSNEQEIVKKMVSTWTGNESLIHFPDKKFSYDDRKQDGYLWKNRLSKEDIYYAKKYLAKDLIEEGYEKDTKWGHGIIMQNLIGIKILIRGAFKFLFVTLRSEIGSKIKDKI